MNDLIHEKLAAAQMLERAAIISYLRIAAKNYNADFQSLLDELIYEIETGHHSTFNSLLEGLSRLGFDVTAHPSTNKGEK